MILDAHAHHFFYSNIDKIIRENIEKGVILIIENGLNYDTNNIVLRLQEKFSIVRAALGLHPVDLSKMNENNIEKTIKQIEYNIDKIIAIGEIGLDYYWIKEEELIRKQKKYLEILLDLGEKYNKPVILHTRKAEEDVIDIVSSYSVKAIFHSFWKPSLVKRIVDNNFYISIPAFVYKDKGLQKIVLETPIDLLLTETDSPFLDPIDKRKNASWKIIYGLKKIAEIKNIDMEELKNKIKDNFVRVFSIKL